MKEPNPAPPNPSVQWVWLLLTVGLLAVLFHLLVLPFDRRAEGAKTTDDVNTEAGAARQRTLPARTTHPRALAPALSAEEIVAGKVTQFAQSRLRLVRAIARRLHQPVPAEIEQFFEAMKAGQWEDIKARWEALAKYSGQYANSTNHREDLDPFWPAVLDAYGAAEQAHLWPAQKLLDYGNAILDSLRPGMVYVGGTDNGRWIPELLNETSGAQPHVIVTQNALADARYLDFVNTLYSDQMSTLTSEDSQAAFQAYLADAQKRLEHDQQFPDEPKQVLPGEEIQMVDGKVQVGGAVSVMAINERLLQTLMQKNPNLSFALQESFPFKDTYSDAAPLGPLMELGAGAGPSAFTPEQAAQSLQYWQNTTQQLLADPEAVDSSPTLRSYSHDIVAAAHLLAAHNFNQEAEQAYSLATQLWPQNPESVAGLADVLAGSGREDEARQLLQNFARQYPSAQQDLQRISSSFRLIAPVPAAPH